MLSLRKCSSDFAVRSLRRRSSSTVASASIARSDLLWATARSTANNASSQHSKSASSSLDNANENADGLTVKPERFVPRFNPKEVGLELSSASRQRRRSIVNFSDLATASTSLWNEETYRNRLHNIWSRQSVHRLYTNSSLSTLDSLFAKRPGVHTTSNQRFEKRRRETDARSMLVRKRELRRPLFIAVGRSSSKSFNHNSNILINAFAQQKQYAFFSTAQNDDNDDAQSKKQQPPPKKIQPPKNFRELGTTQVPTPQSAPPEPETPLSVLRKTTPKGLIRKAMDWTSEYSKIFFRFLVKVPGNLFFFLTHPSELKQKWSEFKKVAKDEVNHYWTGFKLMWADMKTARGLLSRLLQGSTLSRRERKQLLRTTSDIFRLVPFSIFVIIPFMEFALPIALKLFPNMLPSTFQDSLKAEEQMKREVQSRIAMTQFFQDTMEELAKEQRRKALNRRKELEEAGFDLGEEGREVIKKQEDSAASMLAFLEKSRKGEVIPPEVIIRYANFFKDDLTLDNMPRMQLINLCKYMSVTPYGTDAFLRFQLRHRIRILKEDDQRILWEGIDSLTKMELREACQERGMRSTGLSKDSYKRALQQWLDLSVNKNVPISLLIMSRIFFLREDVFERQSDDGSKSLAGLADAISGLDKEVLNEVILEAANSGEKLSDHDLTKIKLEVVAHQNELIRQEQEEREAASKKKEGQDKITPTSAAAAPAAQSADASSSTVAMKDAVNAADGSMQSDNVEKDEISVVNDEKEVDEDRKLSAEEMEAISHLVSDDPVSKEKADLERIKAAILRSKSESGVSNEKLDGKEKSTDQILDSEGNQFELGPMTHEEADQIVATAINKAVDEVSAVAGATSRVSTDDDILSDSKPDRNDKKKKVDEKKVKKDNKAEEEEDDVAVSRLKKRIESMVDKIEVQLSEIRTKIGDKYHLLDKDKDGILSREEVAEVLHQVFKRKISFEEATEIADEIDGNYDGVFTVTDLLKWIEKNKLVKFVEEGRDADMDRVLESQTSDQRKEEEKDDEEKTNKEQSAKSK